MHKTAGFDFFGILRKGKKVVKKGKKAVDEILNEGSEATSGGGGGGGSNIWDFARDLLNKGETYYKTKALGNIAKKYVLPGGIALGAGLGTYALLKNSGPKVVYQPVPAYPQTRY